MYKENKEQLINEGGIATANSIKEEIKKELEYNDYFYEYQKDDIVHTITIIYNFIKVHNIIPFLIF